MGNKKYYDSPEFELVLMQAEDVVRTSGAGTYDDDNVGMWDKALWG